MNHITVEELKSKLSQGEYFLLDVREDDEHERFDIGGTLIPLDEIMARAAEIPTDKPVVVYCRRGIRSQIAIQRLEDRFGITNLVNLQGGLERW
ncbi:rhodanese-like domain-containing protein [Segetibacter sp.]|jgi:rhodanese-related sulfurtransferase|uniref:rhodanese-like domain-containing protein n=1 Tax=Segetibacter sp. TaxID=2231182 RepID=UPI002604C3E1|nr:rhodanese-like domain-containing protein [Segetibacter sp.]MCW3079650.1 rhodanese-like protein [Segetibacter sp.]